MCLDYFPVLFFMFRQCHAWLACWKSEIIGEIWWIFALLMSLFLGLLLKMPGCSFWFHLNKKSMQTYRSYPTCLWHCWAFWVYNWNCTILSVLTGNLIHYTTFHFFFFNFLIPSISILGVCCLCECLLTKNDSCTCVHLHLYPLVSLCKQIAFHFLWDR